MSKGHDLDDILREVQKRKQDKQYLPGEEPPTKVAPDYGSGDNAPPTVSFRPPATPPPPPPTPITPPKKKFSINVEQALAGQKPPVPADKDVFVDPTFGGVGEESSTEELRPSDQLTRMFNIHPSNSEQAEFPHPDTEDYEQPDPYSEQDDSTYDDDVLEFRTHADARIVWQDFAKLKKGLMIRFFSTLLCSILLLYLAFSYEYPLPLPPFIWPESDLRMFFVANLAFLVVAIVMCANTVGGGLISLFTLKADSDSFASMAALGGLVQGVALVVNPDSFATGLWHYYMPVVSLMLMFNTMGKLSMTNRMIAGFRTIAGERRAKFSTAQVNAKDVAREMTRGQNLDVPYVCFPVRTDFFADYLMLAYEEDYSDEVSKVLAPVTFSACVLMAFVSFFFSGSAFGAITVFAAAVCVASPFGAALTGNLPMGRMARRLASSGSMVSGYGAVERLGRTNAVIVSSSDLFPSDNITLHKMRVFQKTAPDQAILDAASVICSCESTLSGMFSQMLGEHPEMLRTVENLMYEDGMGLSAWVDGKRVLIGNRELMHQHGIDLPGHEYERQFYEQGFDLLYLANSGELTAVYVLSYNADPATANALEELYERDITLVVYTTDPNITPKMLQDVFSYPAELIKVLPAKLHEQVKNMTAPRTRSRAYASHNGSVARFIDTMIASETCQRAVLLGTALQLFFVVVGFALVTFMAFMQNMVDVSWLAVIVFQLVGCGLCSIIPALRGS